MSNTNLPNANGPLAPSELVLLNGEQFAKKVIAGNVGLLHSEASVSAAQLGQAMLAAAFLACDQAGGIQLEVREKKAMLGLRKVKSLYTVPASSSVTWPEHSFEARIYPLAQRFDQDCEVADVIYAWLAEDSASPWNAVFEGVKEGLAQRELLERSEQKKLKIFTSVKHELPESTAQLAAQQPIAPIQQLLNDCERNRREVWDLLAKQIKKAIKDRTEQSDMDMDFD